MSIYESSNSQIWLCFAPQNEKQMQPYHAQNNYISDSEDESLSIEHRMPQVQMLLTNKTNNKQDWIFLLFSKTLFLVCWKLVDWKK